MSVIFIDENFKVLNDLLSAYNSEHSDKFCLTFVSKDNKKEEEYGVIKLSHRPDVANQNLSNFKLDLLMDNKTLRVALLENKDFGICINNSEIQGRLIWDWSLKFAIAYNGREVAIKPEDTLSIVEVRK